MKANSTRRLTREEPPADDAHSFYSVQNHLAGCSQGARAKAGWIPAVSGWPFLLPGSEMRISLNSVKGITRTLTKLQRDPMSQSKGATAHSESTATSKVSVIFTVVSPGGSKIR